MKVLTYTFRSFPLEILASQKIDKPFMFGKLHQDLEQFNALCAHEAPDLIIGFALSSSSRQETTAVNRFNTGLIEKDGEMSRALQTISGTPFKYAKHPTHTFCNWTMYKLAQRYPIAFFHVNKSDTETFFTWLKQLLN